MVKRHSWIGGSLGDTIIPQTPVVGGVLVDREKIEVSRMAPRIEYNAVRERGDVMGREDDQRIVLPPVITDMGTDGVDGKGREVEVGEVGLEIVRPLVAKPPLFETNIDEKIVYPGGGGHVVSLGQ